MSLNAFKNGVVFSEANMNALQSSQSKVVIRDGTLVDSKTGAGTTDNEVKDYYFAIRVTATGVTEISRAELEIDADGLAQDLAITFLSSDFNPDGSAEGTVLKTVVVPKEFLPTAAAYWSVPLDVTGLSAGTNYWIKVSKVGDSTNNFSLRGEATQDAAHPCYRRAGTSGAWTISNSIHFNAYSGETGQLVHSQYGDNGWKTIVRAAGRISKIYRYLPPADGAAEGIRNIYTVTRVSDRFKRGVVS